MKTADRFRVISERGLRARALAGRPGMKILPEAPAEATALKIVTTGQDAALLFVPISFTIGPAGQPAQTTRFLMNQVLVKTSDDWRVSSILPIPVPAQ